MPVPQLNYPNASRVRLLCNVKNVNKQIVSLRQPLAFKFMYKTMRSPHVAITTTETPTIHPTWSFQSLLACPYHQYICYHTPPTMFATRRFINQILLYVLSLTTTTSPYASPSVPGSHVELQCSSCVMLKEHE